MHKPLLSLLGILVFGIVAGALVAILTACNPEFKVQPNIDIPQTVDEYIAGACMELYAQEAAWTIGDCVEAAKIGVTTRRCRQ